MATERQDGPASEGETVVEGADSSHDVGAPRGPRSRSDYLRVYLAEEPEGTETYHTTRLCPDFPVPAKSAARADVEDRGFSFCWQCFELEMLALRDE